MLNIKRLQIIINTDKKTFNPIFTFQDGLNIIYSRQNSVGKSSLISSIFYVLGFEELFSTKKNANSLPFVFREHIEVENQNYEVESSKILLELTNQHNKTITVCRYVKSSSYKPGLIFIYDSNLLNIEDTEPTPYYVHSHNAAINAAGFHSYLEDFIGIKLPMVIANNNVERKLYLQLVFSGLFISQKGGWNDYLGNIPYYDIKDSKKKVIRFLLSLKDDFISQQKKIIKKQQKELQNKWKTKYYILSESLLKNNNLLFDNLCEDIDTFDFKSPVTLFYRQENESPIELNKKIILLNDELEHLISPDLKIKSSNMKTLESQYYALIDKKEKLELMINQHISNTELLSSNLEEQNKSLQIIQQDISNNKDILKLRNLGAPGPLSVFDNTCPTCRQTIDDSISIEYKPDNSKLMTLEMNIKHLESQEVLLNFSIESNKAKISDRKQKIALFKDQLRETYQLIRYLKKDLFLPEESHSYSSAIKVVNLDKKIQEFSAALERLPDIQDEFIKIYLDWINKNKSLKVLESTEKEDLDNDLDKLKKFSRIFNDLFQMFGQSSLKEELYHVKVSDKTLLPTINNLDLKSNLSASDMVRSIWAYTLALQQTSTFYNKHHANLIIFDEPSQHNIIEKDLLSLLQTLQSKKGPKQSIIALTAEEDSLVQFMNSPELAANVIKLTDKAIK